MPFARFWPGSMSTGLLLVAALGAGCSAPSLNPSSNLGWSGYSPLSTQDSDDLAADLGDESDSSGHAPVNVDDADLVKAAQNPIANLISLPLQLNTNLDWGPNDDTQTILNIQPVYPFGLNDDWMVITRTILPVINQPLPSGSDEFGLGDTTFTAFFSPTNTEGWTWGVGPVALLPTSTDDSLGAGEWGGGISAVALVMTGPWVVGGIVSNVWSFESSQINSFLVQPFVNYNLADGWYLTTAPIITANWEASSGETWTVPIGGGVGKVFKLGKQPVNMSLQGYKNVEHPTFGAEYQIRFQIQLLFPK